MEKIELRKRIELEVDYLLNNPESSKKEVVENLVRIAEENRSGLREGQMSAEIKRAIFVTHETKNGFNEFKTTVKNGKKTI